MTREAAAGASAEPTEPVPAGRRINAGPGRVLIALYGLFALSATARASVQIATKFHVAPVAYLLSALAGVIYIVATVCLVSAGRTARLIAIACCTVELIGVVSIGTASLEYRSAFPDATVWSGYGEGYGFVPLVLPILGLTWLWYAGRRPDAERSVPEPRPVTTTPATASTPETLVSPGDES